MRRSRTKAVALVVVLLVMVLLVILAGTAALLGSSTQVVSIRGQKQALLLQAADGALHELMDQVNQNPGYGTASSPGTLGRKVNAGGAYTLAMPGQELAGTEYWWNFTEGPEPYSTNNLGSDVSYTRPDQLVVPPGCVLAVVSAYDKGAVAGEKPNAQPVRLAALLTDRWMEGIAADSTIDLKHSVVRDAHPGTGAIVRSNQPDPLPRGDKYAVVVGDVVGDVFCCLESKLIQPDPPSGPWINHGLSPPVELPNIPIDEIVAEAATSATYKFSGSVTAEWQGGKLVIGKKKEEGQAITPPASIYVNGDFTYDGSKVLPAGVRLFVNGDVTLNGGAASGPQPSEPSYIFSTGVVTINGASTLRTHILATDDIRINGNSHLDGFLYVRQGHITVTGGGNGSITGVMIARDFDRSDENVLGKISTSNYTVTTNLEYLAEFRVHFPSVSMRRLYVIAWWRLP